MNRNRRYIKDDIELKVDEIVDLLQGIADNAEETSHYINQYHGKFFDNPRKAKNYIFYRLDSIIDDIEYIKDKVEDLDE